MKTDMHFAMIKNSAHDNAQHQCDLINMNTKYYKAVVKKGFQGCFKIELEDNSLWVPNY